MRTVFLCIVLFYAACDGAGPADEQSLSLSTSPKETLGNSTLFIEVDSTGMLRRGRWKFGPEELNLFSSPISMAGLWLAAEQNGIRANISGYIDLNSFDLMRTENESGGIYQITRDSLQFRILNWPIDLGAPVEMNGDPRIYGDRMAWAAYQPAPVLGGESTSLTGLRVGLSAFLFDEAPLSNALFLRYDIKNISSETISDLYIGYGGDSDVVQYDEKSRNICRTDQHENQTGYDLSRHLTFTYTSRRPEDGDQPDGCYGLVAGYSILNMSSPGGLGRNKLAHRIWRRFQNNISYPEFSELLFENADVMLFALQGLSPTGAPMIDPQGNETRFAFTGDPIAGTGWLDERNDVRSLQSIEPVTLAPGDMRSITVVWLLAKGDDLESGLAALKSQFDQIMARRDAWDY